MTRQDLLLLPAGEASTLLRASPGIPGMLGWREVYWTALDESTVADCLALIGCTRRGANPWRMEPVRARVTRGSRKTQDVEAMGRFDGWIYLFGSQYGRPGGPLESRRSFLARFEEADGMPHSRVRMEVIRDRFRLHRAINDALAVSAVNLVPLSSGARRDFIERTRSLAKQRRKAWSKQVRPADYPINIEGAAFTSDGRLLLGLRFPVTAAGGAIVVEIQGVENAFADGAWSPTDVQIRLLRGAGGPAAPSGIRDLDVDGSDLHLICGGIDPELVDGAPSPAARGFEHRVAADFLDLPGRSVRTRLVRRFSPGERIEGLARAARGGFIYVAERLPEVDRPAAGRVVAIDLPALIRAPRSATAARSS